jgi:hypothetical protein
LSIKYQPGIVLIDAGDGNNTKFLLELEKRQLKYLGGIAKNRKITISHSENTQQTIRIDELAQNLPNQGFTKIELKLYKPKTVWVVTREVEI